MSDAIPSKKKVPKKRRTYSTAERAWLYATNGKEKKAPKTWGISERGTYWWGLYDGYQAGVRAARRMK